MAQAQPYSAGAQGGQRDRASTSRTRGFGTEPKRSSTAATTTVGSRSSCTTTSCAGCGCTSSTWARTTRTSRPTRARRGPDTKYSQSLGLLPQVFTVLGVPLWDTNSIDVTLDFPEGAHTARILFCGLGSNLLDGGWRQYFPSDAYPHAIAPQDEVLFPSLTTGIFTIGLNALALVVDIDVAAAWSAAKPLLTDYLFLNLAMFEDLIQPTLPLVAGESVALAVAGGAETYASVSANGGSTENIWSILLALGTAIPKLLFSPKILEVFTELVRTSHQTCWEGSRLDGGGEAGRGAPRDRSSARGDRGGGGCGDVGGGVYRDGGRAVGDRERGDGDVSGDDHDQSRSSGCYVPEDGDFVGAVAEGRWRGGGGPGHRHDQHGRTDSVRPVHGEERDRAVRRAADPVVCDVLEFRREAGGRRCLGAVHQQRSGQSSVGRYDHDHGGRGDDRRQDGVQAGRYDGLQLGRGGIYVV